VPGASDDIYDWGDNPNPGSYGSMQVHNSQPGQTLFAYNGWGSGATVSDLGIGNSPGPESDWTLVQNASSYAQRVLEVYVLPGPTPLPTVQVRIRKVEAGNLEIIWPDSPAGLVLQTKDLSANSPWLPFTGSVAESGGLKIAREAAFGQGRLYRVIRP
jgi:hypothetical protein